MGEKTNSKELEQLITSQIENEFEFQVPVIVLTQAELRQIVENNPFLSDSTKNPVFMHVTFLSSTPKHDTIDQLTAKNRRARSNFSY